LAAFLPLDSWYIEIIRPFHRKLHDSGFEQHENRAKIVHAMGISVS
jgi:hypothetical protein